MSKSTWRAEAIYSPLNTDPFLMVPESESMTSASRTPFLWTYLAEVAMPWFLKSAGEGRCVREGEIRRQDGVFGARAIHRGDRLEMQCWMVDNRRARYDLERRPSANTWGSRFVPRRGQTVLVKRLGPGRVLNYFRRGDRYGARISLESPPDWYMRRRRVPECLAYASAIGEIHRVVASQ